MKATFAAGLLVALAAAHMSTAYAAALKDTLNAPYSAPVPVALSHYDCTATQEGLQTAAMGQVIKGSYREWVQNYVNTSAGKDVTCVTWVKPTSRQLSRAEAEAFLTDSHNVGGTFGHAGDSAAAVDAAVAAGQTVLPLGIDPAAKKKTAETSEGASITAEATGVTAPQALGVEGDTKGYAVLDLGYGKTPVLEKKAAPAAKKARPATIGVDDRVHVGEKTSFPYLLIGQLITTWKDGTQTLCTGTLVSPHVVISAGQCGHNRDRGGFASKASFAPAQGQADAASPVTRPGGFRYADYVETNNRWTQISGGEAIQTLDARSDYAAFYFVTPWTSSSTFTFMPVVYDDTSALANIAGYPSDVPGVVGINQDMMYGSGTETARSINLLRAFQVREFRVDVSAGQAGAPMWTFDGTSRNIIGVVSYGGDEIAGGAWFGGENKTIISTFVAWTPSQSAPTHLADNLRVPLVIPSGDLSSDSYIRFYNPTAQAGTVAVTFNDGATGQALGTWNSPSLGPFTTLQFMVKDMETAAGFNSAGRARYTVQMSATFPGYFQHVLWNRNGISLTNVSGCGNGLSNDVVHLNSVHSSLFNDTGYPSVVLVHNTSSKAADALLAVYNAGTGVKMGGIIIPGIPANATAAFRMNDVEPILGYAPGPNDFHVNLVQEGDFPGYLQHLVYNTRAGLITNMTAKCQFPLR